MPDFMGSKLLVILTSNPAKEIVKLERLQLCGWLAVLSGSSVWNLDQANNFTALFHNNVVSIFHSKQKFNFTYFKLNKLKTMPHDI